MGLAVPFPMPNGTQPVIHGPTGTAATWVGPTSTGAPWVQFEPSLEQGLGGLEPRVKRHVRQASEKHFFLGRNGTDPYLLLPSRTGVARPTGTAAPRAQLPPAEKQGQPGMAPPVKRHLDELKDVLQAPSDSLPVNVADLKDLPKRPKEFIPTYPPPVPFNGTWPIINGTIPPNTNGTFPTFNSAGIKPLPVPLPEVNHKK